MRFKVSIRLQPISRRLFENPPQILYQYDAHCKTQKGRCNSEGLFVVWNTSKICLLSGGALSIKPTKHARIIALSMIVACASYPWHFGVLKRRNERLKRASRKVASCKAVRTQFQAEVYEISACCRTIKSDRYADEVVFLIGWLDSGDHHIFWTETIFLL